MPHPWICPFCPLHCEDVAIERQSDGMRTIAPDCSLAQRAINRLDLDRKDARAARVRGSVVDWQEAIQYVADRLSQAEAVALGGSLTGLGTARSVLGFAERIGAVTEHDASESQNALRATMAREGVFSATLGDVRRYADLVILIGYPEQRFPRLLERFAGDGLVEKRSRRIVSLESPADCDVPHEPAFRIPAAARLERLSVSGEHFSDFLAAVRRHVGGQAADHHPELDEQTANQLRKMTGWLDAASYVAVVLGPAAFGAFGRLGAEVEAGGLIASVATLNQERRAVLLSLDSSLSFRQVALWRSGFSGPVGWQEGVPAPFEGGQFETICQSPGTVRLQIECSPGAGFAPSSRLGRVGESSARSAVPPSPILLAVEGAGEEVVDDVDAFLPIAAPGIDLADAVVRGDGSVTLPLKPVRSPLEPTLAETLGAISEARRFPADTAAVRPRAGR